MKPLALKLTALTLALSAFSISSQAQVDRLNVVTTSVPFLRISPDARAGGMGDMGLATNPDATSAFWNLSKISFAKNRSGISLNYTPWLRALQVKDVYLLAVSGYHQLDELNSISGSIRYFSLGNIQFTDIYGAITGEGRPREFAIDAGYARKLSKKMSLAVALRYINSNLAGGATSGNGDVYKAGTAIAGDITYFYTGQNDKGQGWNFGVALTNLGSKISYTNNADRKDFIPANFGIGTTYTRVFDENNKLTVGLDANKLLVPTPPASSDPNAVNKYYSTSSVEGWFKSWGDAPNGFGEELKEFTLSFGAEYSYMDQFMVRAGYFWEDNTKGARKYFTLGAGVKYNVFGINFSYLVPSGQGVTRNPLSNTVRFGITFDLDGDKGGDKK
jgi:hypothetical protein